LWTGLRLLGRKLGLLLCVCSLCGSLGLLVLLAVSLVDSLCNCLPTNSLSHLGSFALPKLNRANKAGLRL
jgi:hypothetical protein